MVVQIKVPARSPSDPNRSCDRRSGSLKIFGGRTIARIMAVEVLVMTIGTGRAGFGPSESNEMKAKERAA